MDNFIAPNFSLLIPESHSNNAPSPVMVYIVDVAEIIRAKAYAQWVAYQMGRQMRLDEQAGLCQSPAPQKGGISDEIGPKTHHDCQETTQRDLNQGDSRHPQSA